MLARMRKDQLDGIVSGGMLCERLAPSMRVLRMVGLFQTRDESGYVAGRLKPLFDEEFRKQGFVNLGDVGIGPDLIFSREPMRTHGRPARARSCGPGTSTMSSSRTLAAARRARWCRCRSKRPTRLRQRRVDGFIAMPTAALAFQWSTQARYVTDLRVGSLRGCVLISHRAFDRAAARAAATRFRNSCARSTTRASRRWGGARTRQLLGGLFEKQGLKPVAVTEAFRSEFFDDGARGARAAGGAGGLVPPRAVAKVLTLLADYRAEHRAVEGEKLR